MGYATILSRGSFRRAAVSGQKFFTVLSLHISNTCAEKKGIAKKLIQTLRAIKISEEVDLVAGDFIGAAWRCRNRDNLSTIDEAFADCLAYVIPGSIPNNWADVCGFLKPPGSQRFWKVNKHGAFSIPRQALGQRQNDQSCHHENMASFTCRRLEQQMVPSSALQPEHPPYGTTCEFWIWNSKASFQRGYEQPFVLIVNAQPLALPWFLRLHLLIITK